MSTEYAYDGFDKTIGLQITSATADEVVATLPVTAQLLHCLLYTSPSPRDS